jgi:steroid delta-isomerase-like uncharacterized protein
VTSGANPQTQVRRFYDEIWNRPDVAVVPEILAPDVTFRGSLGPVKVGHAEFIDYVNDVTGALGDYRCDIETLVTDGDRAAARMLFSGVHRANFLGVPATGRRVAWAGAAFFTFSGGLVSDLWVLGDLEGLRAQLNQSDR